VQTASELLIKRAARVKKGIGELLERSSLTDASRDWGSGVVFGATGQWSDLDVEGRRVQSRVLEDYRRFFETIGVLLRAQPPDALGELEEADTTVREILEQSTLSWIDTIEEARAKAIEAIDTEVALLERLHNAGEGADVFLPDMNALLYNPELELWEFPDSERCELVLGPSILVELDELKVNHRNPDIRERAEGLISRIKGYRGRGQLTAGVPLRKPVSTLRALAAEPRMSESLSWLDPSNRDDRFIATAIETMRQHPRSAVTIVTRDINLQSKAELASLPFIEPPEPGSKAKQV
jgi:PIN domain